MPDEKTFAEQANQRRKRHRRSVRTGIILPFVGTLLLLVVLTASALISGRAATIADMFLTILVLCPLAICLLPVYLVMVILIGLMGQANQSASKGLVRVGSLLDNLEGRVPALAEQAAQVTIRWNSAFAFLDKIAFRLFDPVEPKPEAEDEG